MREALEKLWKAAGAPLKLIAGYLIVLLIAALVTPSIYAWLHGTLGHPFERYFDRLRYAGLLVMLPVVWRWTGYKHWREIGWGQAGKIGWMFIAGVVCVGLAASIIEWVNSEALLQRAIFWDRVGIALLAGVATGLSVAFLEELVFRAMMVRVLVRGSGLWAGVIIAALFFAFLHGRPHGGLTAPFDIPTALNLAWQYVGQWPHTFTVVSFLNLVLLGFMLGMLYIRSGSIWLPMGLHAGIVSAAIPLTSLLRQLHPWMHSDVLISSRATTIMLITLAVAVAFYPKSPVANAIGGTAAGTKE